MALDTIRLTEDWDLDLNADGSANLIGEADAIGQDVRVILETPLGSHPIHRTLGLDAAAILNPPTDEDGREVQVYSAGAVERAILANATGIADIESTVVRREPGMNTVTIATSIRPIRGGTIFVESRVA